MMFILNMIELTESIEAGVVYDHLFSGGADEKGEIQQLWGKPALDNAIRMWLASLSGEILRAPTRSGYLRRWLLKPMSEVNIETLEMTIRDGFDQDFVPFMQVLDLNITPDLEKRKWIFYLRVFSTDLKILTEISEEIKARV